MPRIFLLFLIPLYAYKCITCKTQQRGKAEHFKKADLILHKTFTPTIKKYNLLPLESVRSRKCSWKIITASTSTPETSAEDAGTISSILCVVKMGQCQTLPRWGTAGKSLTCLLRPLNIFGYVQIQDGKLFFFFLSDLQLEGGDAVQHPWGSCNLWHRLPLSRALCRSVLSWKIR